MENEVYRKLLLDSEKVLRNFQNFGKLPADEVKRCFLQLAGIANSFVSTMLGRKGSIDADYFVLKDMLSPGVFHDLYETYFTISSLGSKEFTKVSRDAVKVRSWKSTEIVDKALAVSLSKQLENSIRSAHKSFKGG